MIMICVYGFAYESLPSVESFEFTYLVSGLRFVDMLIYFLGLNIDLCWNSAFLPLYCSILSFSGF